MSTITQEWLQQTIAEYEANRDELPFGLDTNSAIELQAFKLALASLEAEAVAEVCEGFTLRYIGYGPAPTSGVHIGDRLYTVPQAPVSVPDAIEPTVEAIKRILPTSNPDDYAACIGADMWNACRAAMLQGADGNSPVIPDGWVACSERMPEAIGEYLVAYKWMNRWIYQKVITFAHLSEYTNEMGWNSDLEITHWMPLPAAPSQEIKYEN